MRNKSDELVGELYSQGLAKQGYGGVGGTRSYVLGALQGEGKEERTIPLTQH